MRCGGVGERSRGSGEIAVQDTAGCSKSASSRPFGLPGRNDSDENALWFFKARSAYSAW